MPPRVVVIWGKSLLFCLSVVSGSRLCILVKRALRMRGVRAWRGQSTYILSNRAFTYCLTVHLSVLPLGQLYVWIEWELWKFRGICDAVLFPLSSSQRLEE